MASVGPCCVVGAFAVCAALVFANEVHGVNALTQLAVVIDWRSVLCWVFMLFCAVLMQAATNTLNDYQDFKSGLDTAETVLDETDASIVYNHINPKSALVFALAQLAVAAVIGVTVALLTSWWLLVWGVVAAAVTVLYSVGPKPISSLPIGEVVSGVALGGVLTCVTFYATTLSFSALIVGLALLPTITIAQIMQTNNTCDIDRDIKAGRRTLPGIIGHRRSALLNAALSVVAFLLLALILVWSGLFYGLPVVALGFVICLPKINRLLKGPYDLTNRRTMMGTAVSYNRWLCVTTVVAVLFGGILNVFI